MALLLARYRSIYGHVPGVTTQETRYASISGYMGFPYRNGWLTCTSIGVRILPYFVWEIPTATILVQEMHQEKVK